MKNKKRSRLDQKQEQTIFAMLSDFRYHSENSVIVKIEIFAMHSNFRYDSENSSVAKFSALFHCSLSTIPFLLALIFFIPGLLKLIENHMKLMEINPTLL